MLISIAVSLLVLPVLLPAQAPDLGEVPAVQYESGGIKSQYLPYGRRWAITGSPATSRGVADVIWARIKPHTKAEFKDNVGPCWVRPRTAAGELDKTVNAFRINFGRDTDRLRLGEPYDLRLDFYSGAVSGLVLNPIVKAAFDTAVEHAAVNRSLNSGELLDIINLEVHRALGPLMTGDNPALIRLQPLTLEGICQVDAEIPAASLDAEQSRALQDAVIDQILGRDVDAVLELVGDSIEHFGKTLPDFSKKLFLAAKRSKDKRITAEEISALSEAVSRSRSPERKVIDRLLAAADPKTCPSKLSPLTKGDCDQLDALAKLFRRFADTEASRPDATQIQVRRKDVQLTLEGAYRVVGRTEIVAYSYENAVATSDKLRIGTAYGFGAAFLSPFRNRSADAFALVGLKLYRWAVDKSLPDPYFGRPNARYSLVFGFLSNSSLRYRGQAQEKLAGDLMPILGIADDLKNDVTFQLGIIGFRQPSTNPVASLTNSNSKPRIAPYVSLGIDFDAANRLKSLLAK
jgi:hypothetical protein